MIPRLIQNTVFNSLISQPVITLLLGARQVGKTVLVKSIQKQLESNHHRVLYLNCDLEENLAVINTTSQTALEQLTKNINFLLVDEAQRLANPGLTLKILLDNFPAVKVLATGSSSFELRNHLSDALTGRYLDFSLYPLSLTEIINFQNFPPDSPITKNQTNALLTHLLLYGFYPAIFQVGDPALKRTHLAKIVESYLFKDVLSFNKIRYSQALKDLTVAIAYQIGSEVNEDELGRRTKIDRKTVISYLDILEKSYVIVRHHPFSQNPRREIGHKYKIYFVDLGIRNAIINDFNPFLLRADIGALWENFLIIERFKFNANSHQSPVVNFWRSYSGAEVDYLEKDSTGKLAAFEFKYGIGKLSKGAHAFTGKYKSPVSLINSDNYLSFVTGHNPKDQVLLKKPGAV
jgi:hypothetical protein